MKRISLVITFLLSSFFLSAQPDALTAKDFERLQWLEGVWNRTGMKPGHSAHEVWEKSSAHEYTGLGVSLRGSDTTFVEKLKILLNNEGIYYVADVPENQQPVYFKFTSITDSTFVCENPDHDFPRKISYSLEGRGLKARISGGEKTIDFVFERKQ